MDKLIINGHNFDLWQCKKCKGFFILHKNNYKTTHCNCSPLIKSQNGGSCIYVLISDKNRIKVGLSRPEIMKKRLSVLNQQIRDYTDKGEIFSLFFISETLPRGLAYSIERMIHKELKTQGKSTCKIVNVAGSTEIYNLSPITIKNRIQEVIAFCNKTILRVENGGA